MGGDMVHNLTLPECYSKITVFLTGLGFVGFPTAHSCKRVPPKWDKDAQTFSWAIFFSHTRKHSSLFSPNVCRYAWKHSRKKKARHTRFVLLPLDRQTCGVVDHKTTLWGYTWSIDYRPFGVWALVNLLPWVSQLGVRKLGLSSCLYSLGLWPSRNGRIIISRNAGRGMFCEFFSVGLSRSRILTLQAMFWFIMKSIPVRNRILKCWFLEERGKPRNLKKRLLKQVARKSFLGPGSRVFPPPGVRFST